MKNDLKLSFRTEYINMMTINLPPDIASPLAEEALKLGTTAELLAVERLRKIFTTTKDGPSEYGTLFDYLSDHIGAVDGTTEALSENCGQRFAKGMAEKQRNANA